MPGNTCYKPKLRGLRVNNKSNLSNISEATAEITISKSEYDSLQTTIKNQQAEINALEYRIKTILSD
jgi:septal ring factor EnvC (AmiA/AmiB activator)